MSHYVVNLKIKIVEIRFVVKLTGLFTYKLFTYYYYCYYYLLLFTDLLTYLLIYLFT